MINHARGSHGPFFVNSHDGRHHEGDHLSGGHDDGEDDGSELLDGVEDEQLPGGGGDRQSHHVVERRRVRGQEPEALGEPAVLRSKEAVQTGASIIRPKQKKKEQERKSLEKRMRDRLGGMYSSEMAMTT